MYRSVVVKKLCLFFVTTIFCINSHAYLFVISGNKRTKESHIKNLFKKCAKNGLMEIQNIEQCILNSRLFVKVKIIKSKNKIHINVEDRWTLLPIPFARSEREETKYGLFLFERNLFGMGKMLVFGGSTGDQSSSIFTLYKDPYLFYTDYTLELKLRINKANIYLYNGKNKVDGFQSDIKRFAFEFGKRFHNWSPYGGIGFLKDKFKTLCTSFRPEDNSSIAAIVGFEFDKSEFKFYFNQGTKSEFKYSQEIYQNNKGILAKKLWGQISWQFNPVKDHALQILNTVSYLFSGGPEDIIHLGGTKGYRGVPQGGIWSKGGISLSADYQVPLAHPKYGTWTVAPFTEYGYTKKYSLKSTSDASYAFGIGGYLFLKKVAMPGLGVVVGRNPNYKQNFIM